ncbi:hypothetical protein [Nesterenkonia rhizosphaerae]|uniref:Uncharacterized protein n=1 Tax=Nesterenkonia rhizosphaerae TaxID=1348272 RepID=A0ABP9FPE3_9MICC
MIDIQESWSHSLEDVVSEYTRRHFVRRKPLGFTPKKVRNPEAYLQVPAVLVVASASTRHLHRALFESIELLEKASGAFKVAVFAEAGSEKITKAFDWAVEHVFSEHAWWGMSDRNWLKMASERLEWAQQMYGASYVVAARSVPEATAEIARLGVYFNVDKIVVASAQAHLEASAPQVEQGHSWIRGWWHTLPQGPSEHRFAGGAFDGFRLSINARGSAMTLVSSGSAHSSLVLEAEHRGWNSVVLHPSEGSKETFELALRRAVTSAFSQTSQVFHAVTAALPLKSANLGAGTIVHSERTGWTLADRQGFSFVRSGVTDVARAMEHLGEAIALSQAMYD